MSPPIDPQEDRNIMEHLSIEQLEAFGAGELPAPIFLACDEHLAGCDECREAFARLLDVERSLGSLIQSLEQDAVEHLTYEQVRIFAEGKLLPSDAVAHVKVCASCTAEVQDLKLFIEETTIEPRKIFRVKSWMYGAVAAAILIACGIGVQHFSLNSLNRMQESSSAVPVALQPSKPMIPQEYQDLLAETAASGRLPVPIDVTGKQETETLLGTPSSESAFRLLSPVNVTIMSDRPVFRWEPTHNSKNAVTYSVAIYDRSYQKIAESQPTTSTEWQIESPLKRGYVYRWFLTVRSAHTVVRIPVPPQREVDFKVMEQTAENQLQTDQSKYGDNHLLMAVLFARAGDLDSAKRELDAVAPLNPQAELAHRLQQTLAESRDFGGDLKKLQ
jgi:hypothetical protein